MNKQLNTELEQLLDRYTATAVMRELHDVCLEKAMHIEMNWQDAPLASVWNKLAGTLAKSVTVATDHKI